VDYALFVDIVKIPSFHQVDGATQRPGTRGISMSVLVAGPGAVPSVKAHRWWTALVAYFTAAEASVDTDGLRVPKRVPPKSYTYLENSAMRRAMERL
jgi:hypothetical protein